MGKLFIQGTNDRLKNCFELFTRDIAGVSAGFVHKSYFGTSAIWACLRMHHKLFSRFIVDTLYKHGFECSYSEIKMFEHSEAVQRAELPNHSPGQLIQFVANNVD